MVILGEVDRKRALERIKNETNLVPIQQDNGSTLWTTNANVFPIDGLYYDSKFLTPKEQERAVSLVDSASFSTAISRRQQFWGETYYHTTHNITAIQPSSDGDENSSLSLSSFQWLLDKLDCVHMAASKPGTYTYQQKLLSYESTPPGIFVHERATQILVNEYVDGQGIAHHLDDPYAFGHILVMISLISPIYMTFTLPRGRTKVLLEPGSLIVMKGEARYCTVHGITRQKWLLMPDGEFVSRIEGSGYRRLSLTIRQLLDGRKRVNEDSRDWIDGPKVSV